MNHLNIVDSVGGRRIENGQFDQRIIKPAQLQRFSDAGSLREEVSYVLYSLGKDILADQALTLFCFSYVQPGDTLVKKVTERFRFDCFSDGRR